MTPRERLLAVLSGNIPDCVPVTPDLSNMIPVRLTGKPFWDIYLYEDPPIWEAYVAAAKRFNFDGWLDAYEGYLPPIFPDQQRRQQEWTHFIVFRSPERIVTQACRETGGRRTWSPKVDVYHVADPPTFGVDASKLGLPPTPTRWEPIEARGPSLTGVEALRRAKAAMGEQGVVAVQVASTAALASAEGIYAYYDNPDKHERWAADLVELAKERFAHLMSLEVKPDVIAVGGSGTLVYQTIEMFRRVAFPAVKRVIELASAVGIPTHVHSCGPEKELVRIFAEETDLTVIDPLEPPPMGDCDLVELKRRFGNRIVLKGNVHTIDIMLRGTQRDVVVACEKAIDGAAAGGMFVLSTGDQCNRDTPDGNIRAMVETARNYGRY